MLLLLYFLPPEACRDNSRLYSSHTVSSPRDFPAPITTKDKQKPSVLSVLYFQIQPEMPLPSYVHLTYSLRHRLCSATSAYHTEGLWTENLEGISADSIHSRSAQHFRACFTVCHEQSAPIYSSIASTRSFLISLSWVKQKFECNTIFSTSRILHSLIQTAVKIQTEFKTQSNSALSPPNIK